MRRSVLVVDDDAVVRQLLHALLAEAGYHIREAANGRDALIEAKADPPDVMLLDVMLPDLNGYLVCQALSAFAATQSIPVILITASESHAVQASAGVAGCLVKPFSRATLLATVAAALPA